ncbi:hypothetical protein BDW66DRAFT_130014 [Aspergillus desertorum]
MWLRMLCYACDLMAAATHTVAHVVDPGNAAAEQSLLPQSLPLCPFACSYYF